ncbi:selenide, water dikinase SelD [Bacillus solimangrovi]|uniref:Selenide, water dikinase n=1 Tax=Bacillus solimangrovi TaxID=1305675 RepID=A0A1E5LEJ8_9BACI|nr:selenide, water dikinase SelD [Bacillus solimangrovi]
MRYLPKQSDDPNVLIGTETSDDAGVYKLSDDTALIQTVDYFTPIVDDPYTFGAIAAANALSDVYAMGGTPKTVLNIVGFPIKKLGSEMLAQILLGASDKVQEAGAITIGGHSIDDQEPKFGLSVTGTAHPDQLYQNVGAKENDVLVLTKPIGVGILTTAIKRNVVTLAQEESVIKTMITLNKVASIELKPFDVHAVTDVTGFGLLGHAYEMASGSNVTFELSFSDIPLLDGTKDLAHKGVIPGGSKSNHRWLKDFVTYDETLTEIDQLILCDAITSGGLLISMPADDAEKYLSTLKQTTNTEATIIGKVVAHNDTWINVKK